MFIRLIFLFNLVGTKSQKDYKIKSERSSGFKEYIKETKIADLM